MTLTRLTERLCRAFVLALVCAPTLARAAEELPEIHWQMIPLPLVHERSDSGAPPGFQDRILFELLIPQLKEFHHTTDLVPLERRNQSMLDDQLACTPSAIATPERRAKWRFSKQAVVTMLGPGVYALNDTQRKLQGFVDSSGRLRLEPLLADPSIMVGTARGRSSGAVADKLLAATDASRIFLAASENPIANLAQMLKSRRFDVLMGQPYEHSFISKAANISPESLIFWPIAEQEPTLQIFVACHSGPAGRERLARIEKLLANAEFRNAAQHFYEAILRPAERERLRRALTTK